MNFTLFPTKSVLFLLLGIVFMKKCQTKKLEVFKIWQCRAGTGRNRQQKLFSEFWIREFGQNTIEKSWLSILKY